MPTERLFLRVSSKPGLLKLSEIPEGGFCLSAFLVISNSRNPKEVLLGHLNPDAPWDHIGALDPPRVEMNKNGWLLPACHLIVGESPQVTLVVAAEELHELRVLWHMAGVGDRALQRLQIGGRHRVPQPLVDREVQHDLQPVALLAEVGDALVRRHVRFGQQDGVA